MRFYPNHHQFYCGLDVPARSMHVCIVSQDGDILVHRHMTAAPEPFLKTVAPYRDGLVVAVEGLFTWYWLAALCADQGIPFVRGPALSLPAIQGGKAKNDKIDAPKIAALLRGGMLPQASVSPAQMRATRDLLRRRTHLMHTRAALLSHVQHTNSQSNVPEIGNKIAYQAKREGVAERCADAAGQKNIAVALALITYDDALLRDRELSPVTTATHHAATTLYLLHTVPGIGKMLRLVLLDDIHRLDRFPSVQDCASYGRLVTCSKESGGKRLGTSGHKIGNAHLTGAFGEAAALLLRTKEAGQTYLARVANNPDQGTALSLLAHQRARAVYSRRKRQVACALDILLRR